jgi:polyphosphate glucokinase
MKILVIDIGGTNVKVRVSGQKEPIKIPSGPTMSVRKMVTAVKKVAEGWKYDAVSIGYPGIVLRGNIITEPHNLARGWVGFNFKKAFNRPLKLVNDAAMQALGSYEGKTMLFLGLGTGLGSALIVEGVLVPLELAHLPYKHGQTYEEYLGLAGLMRLGKKKWRRHVDDVVQRLKTAMEADYVILGGGNSKLLKKLPLDSELGDNANAFRGGERLWQQDHHRAHQK